MTNINTRERILTSGLSLVMLKGFQATGLKEILDASGVPKGSFYHFFPSKEQFGLELIDHFIVTFWANLELAFNDQSMPPLDRLRLYFDRGIRLLKDMNFTGGCPVGNLSQEMSDSSPLFRKKLSSIYEKIIKQFTSILEEACSDGSLPPDSDCHATATFIFNSWEGAIIHMKVISSPAPLLIFEKMIFEKILNQARS